MRVPVMIISSHYRSKLIKMKKNTIFILILFFALTGAINAQKYGYVNSSQLLLSMPEIKQADQTLLNYQNELIAKGEKMVERFESNYNDYLVKVNNGELSQVQMQQSEASLAQEQQAIQKFEVEVQQLIAKRKQELYSPILKKVQDLVDKIAQEEGYMMIFDASIGGILFAKEADDLMPLLKQRLGI